MVVFVIFAIPTLILVGIAALTLITGIVLFYFPRQRSIAPFVLFMPTLAALGAAVGSLGLFIVADRFFEPSFAGARYLGWLAGFPVGASLGLVLGSGLAFWIRQRLSSRHDNAA
jgi:hypothetical protein